MNLNTKAIHQQKLKIILMNVAFLFSDQSLVLSTFKHLGFELKCLSFVVVCWSITCEYLIMRTLCTHRSKVPTCDAIWATFSLVALRKANIHYNTDCTDCGGLVIWSCSLIDCQCQWGANSQLDVFFFLFLAHLKSNTFWFLYIL